MSEHAGSMRQRVVLIVKDAMVLTWYNVYMNYYNMSTNAFCYIIHKLISGLS